MPAATLAEDCRLAPPPAAGWAAELELRFERRASRTVLATRRHVGPLRVQKALYPEGDGVCQAIIVHPPGGIVAGDTLRVAIDAGPGAHAQLTTPGAAKWYRSTGSIARSSTVLQVSAGARVEWLPQETLLFDGARAAIRLRVELAPEARFIGWDIVHLGRTAAGERFASGRLHQALELCCGATTLWHERAVIEGGSRALQAGALLKGAPAFGTLVAAGAAVDDGVLAACRAILPASGEGAVTRLPGVLVARYLGNGAETARTYLASLWRVLRPALLGRDAVPPRIWNT
jgi:urease accessory protein